MSPKLSHAPFDLVSCMPSKLLLVVDAHTKFEVSSFSCSKHIGPVYKNLGVVRYLRFDIKRVLTIPHFRGATEYHLVKFERNLSKCG